jgi:tRNA pseudouridine55 synthase
VGAHVAELRRTRAGQFKIADALTLDQLSEAALSGSLDQVLISPDAALSHLPVTDLTSDDARRIGQGIDLHLEEASASTWPNGQAVRLRNADGRLIAVGIYDEGRRTVHPQVVIVNT